MVDDEQQAPEGAQEGPRRRTYAPPSENAVFTGSAPLGDSDDFAEVSGMTPGSEIPDGPAAVSSPTVAKAPPVRQSLSDTEIMARFDRDLAGNTIDMVLELERQVALRLDEEEQFEMWANLTRATGGEFAEEIIRRERIIFDGGIPELEPEPDLEPEPELEPSVLVELIAGAVPPAREEVTPAEAVLESEPPMPQQNFPEGFAQAEDAELDPNDQWPLGEMVEPRTAQEDLADEEDDGAPATGVTAGLVWMWASSLVPVLGMVAGAYLVSRGASLVEALVVVFSSALLAGLVVAAGARVSGRFGTDTLGSSMAAFGSGGAKVPGVLVLLIRLATISVLVVAAVVVVTRVLVISGLWVWQAWIAQVTVGAVVAGLILALAILGGSVLRVALFSSAGLGFLGVVGFAVVFLDEVPSISLGGFAESPLALAGLVAVVFSGFLVLLGTSSGDITALKPGSGRSIVPLVVALGAVVPLSLSAVIAAAVASTNPALALTLVTDPAGSIVSGLPSWYPIPMVMVLGLPLVGFVAFLVHSAGSGLGSLGLPLGVRGNIAVMGVLAVGGAAAVLVFGLALSRFFPDVLVSAGVVLAAWAGAFAIEGLFRTHDMKMPPVRFAPFLGWAVSLGLGFGLISSSVSWLSWQGYLLPVLGQLGLMDLAPAAPGVFVALFVSALVSLIAGLGFRAKGKALDYA